MSFPSQDLCNVVPLVIAEKLESSNSENTIFVEPQSMKW